MTELHKGKRFLVMGLRDTQSLAYAIIKMLRSEGAEVIATYMGERVREQVELIARDLGVTILPCNVTSPDEIRNLFARIQEVPGWSGKAIDGVVHAIAFAKTMTRVTDIPLDEMADQINLAMTTSATSFMMIAQVAHPFMTPHAAFIGLGYNGGARHEPGYNGPIGLAKVGLKYMMEEMARTYGAMQLRALLVSPGPIETAAAKGIVGFESMQKRALAQSPLHEAATPQDVANMVSFLLSKGAYRTSGQDMQIDGGRQIVHENVA